MHCVPDVCFHECILLGSLKHYFIPEFNLLSVKLKAAARDEILQSDISIMKECSTLKPVWEKFVYTDSGGDDSPLRRQENLLKSDVCLMSKFGQLQTVILSTDQSDLISVLNRFVSKYFQNSQITCLISFVVNLILFRLSNGVVCNNMPYNGNRTMYISYQLRLNTVGIDISTCRLWYAMIMTMKSEFHSSLCVLNYVLSSISPFPLYDSYSNIRNVSNETKTWYDDVFSSGNSPVHVTERARQAWLFDLRIIQSDMDMVPVAIQIELTHCDKELGVFLSPFVCAYYLMFLNYHALRQYENRDRALQQLIETVNNTEQCGDFGYHSFNIAGHCLLSIGLHEQARDMFIRSYQFTCDMKPLDRFNSARHYLQCLPL